MLETTSPVVKPSAKQNDGLSTRFTTIILPVLIVGIVIGSLCVLQWTSLSGITLGYPAPQVQIMALSTSTLVRNQSYMFSATGTGRDLSYAWNFGDQSTDNLNSEQVHHTYQNNGSFTITVTVTDPTGHQATQSKTITVAPPQPQAFFTYTAEPSYYASASQYIAFDASNSIADSSTVITTYNWNFGDGTSDTIAYSQETHTYNTQGTYQVSLIVIDETGQASKAYTTTITITTTTP